jgi:hypothetical protein
MRRLLRVAWPVFTAGVIASCFGVDMGGGNAFTCAKDADCLSGRTCSSEGFCVGAASDAGGDAAVDSGGDAGQDADGGPADGDAGCAPETNNQLCARLGKTCGPVTANDNCGQQRVVPSCGQCNQPELCAANDRPNKCSVPSSCQRLPPGSASAVYTLQPTAADATFSAYCDTVTDGGGWMLVHTKGTPAFSPWSMQESTACSSSGTADCAARVPSAVTWTHALWRFAENNNVWVKWDRSAHADFASFLEGGAVSLSGAPVGGFTRNVNGVSTGPSTINEFWYSGGGYVSEVLAAGSDQWLNLWNGADSTNNYTSCEDGSLCGTKCVGGYCSASPVWLMVR